MSKPGFAATRKSGPGQSNKLCIILCAVSLVLFTFSCREAGQGPISAVKDATTVVTKPVQMFGSLITTPVRNLGNIFSNLTASSETLSELKEENQKLVARNAELEEAQQTAKRLEGILNIKGSYDLQSTGARIISGATDSWAATVVIDKGTNDGLSVGMPVCDSYGVIGQICECGATSSRVRLITDEKSSVSAMIESSRAQGMLQGSASGQLRLTLVKTDKEVKVGDLVVTSGLGGIYPKGLPLGKVSSVEKPDGALFYTIMVRPLASVENSEEVLVITALKENQQATPEESAEADKSGSFPVKPEDAKNAQAAQDGQAQAQDKKSDA